MVFWSNTKEIADLYVYLRDTTLWKRSNIIIILVQLIQALVMVAMVEDKMLHYTTNIVVFEICNCC